jgi:hypothetical protein
LVFVMGSVACVAANAATCNSKCSSTASNVCRGATSGSCPGCVDGTSAPNCSGIGVVFANVDVYGTDSGSSTTHTENVNCQKLFSCENATYDADAICEMAEWCSDFYFRNCRYCRWDSGTWHTYSTCKDDGCCEE